MVHSVADERGVCR